MGEAIRRNRLGLNKVGSIRYPKYRRMISDKRCEKCGGKTYEEYNEDYYQDGVEYSEVLRCEDCDFEKMVNVDWEDYIN